MTQKRDFKRRVRDRQAKTGESYVTARRHVLAERPKAEDAEPVTGRTTAVTEHDTAEAERDNANHDKVEAERDKPVHPIIVDEVIDLTDVAAEVGLQCRMLVYAKVAKLVDPARAIAAIAKALAATPNDPAMDLLRKVAAGVRSTEPTQRPLRHVEFWERIAAGLTGVSPDGRALALHVDGHAGMVTILCAAWRQTATMLVTTADETTAQVVSRLGSTATGGALFLIYNGRRYPIGREPFVIGRYKSSNLQIKDGNISRKHAMVVRRRDAYYIVDLGSYAGIEYRGLKIENKRIEEGDLFRLGEYAVRFTYLETDA